MNWRKFCKVAILCCLVVWLIAIMVQPAHAAVAAKPAGGAGGDKSIAEKKGIEGLFQSNKFSKDDPRAPTKLQKYLGLGSFAVMIIVVKYL